ncbi:MAG TPA: hypothetical protein VGN34_23510 [Ktedonobacteraceae bacterium]
MSEYQRYEFMTCDRPLTREQLDEVNDLSSHIEASSTHAVIEYNWGDFKHDPIEVLHDYFDGFLYWANWGTPRLALRFPHGALPADLLEPYGFDDFYVTFTQNADYDILDMHFDEMEALDEWTEYDLGSLVAIRDELMAGDLRSLYIVWLACVYGTEDDEEDTEAEDYPLPASGVPPVPPGFARLTDAQEELADLFRVSEELLLAAAQHSSAAGPVASDDFVAWVELLPQDRRSEYLVKLANNEPGLSRQLVKELRELGKDKTSETPSPGERVDYNTLYRESQTIGDRLERERLEEKQRAHQRHLQEVCDHREDYWRQVDEAVARGTGSGYDEATRFLVELRDVAQHFNEAQAFQTRFSSWMRTHMRRPAFVKRLHDRQFILPEA